MRPIRRIVIHHSASRDDGSLNMKAIRTWHLQRGWNDIGYHIIVEKIGVFPEAVIGRPWYKIGAHAKGANMNSIGICVVGHDEFEDEVFRVLKRTVNMVCIIFGIDKRQVFGHCEVGSTKTECPGDTLFDWIKIYRLGRNYE
jgi:hypothetical protein